MKPKKLDGVEVWKQLEDVLAPRFKLSVLDRPVYSHLLRHTSLEGKLRLRFSIVWLAGNLNITSRHAAGCAPPGGHRRFALDRTQQHRSRRRRSLAAAALRRALQPIRTRLFYVIQRR